VGEFDSDAPWFSEGLTTYLSAVLPCRYGLETATYCAASINNSTHTYYESEARNWPLSRIKASTGSENIRRAPYGRGMLYFAELDSELRRTSHGARGLEDLLSPLFLMRQNGTRLNDAEWEKLLLREVGPQAVKDFRSQVIDGATTLIPPSTAFGVCLERVSAHWIADGTQRSVDGYEWRAVEACSPQNKSKEAK
jgi:predicted metalloprotease with PDZ domain